MGMVEEKVFMRKYFGGIWLEVCCRSCELRRRICRNVDRIRMNKRKPNQRHLLSA
jgi:hypothetical protein